MEQVTFTPIGVVRSPFRQIEDMPIQAAGAAGVAGTIEIEPALVEGLQDLDGFSHLFIIYHFHCTAAVRLTVIPFLDTTPRGVFATRAPCRPNAIGLSVVELKGVEGSVLHIDNVDMLDGTPVLDIKPYVPAFDHFEAPRVGWLERSGHEAGTKRSDDRFKG